MSKGNYYNRYVWLMNTLLQAKRISFEEISSRWERDWEYKLPKHISKSWSQKVFVSE